MNGFFQAEEIKGGLYSLKDVYPAKIGLISNAILETETSSIQIGEIGENVAITDFNSKFYFYNFSNNFKQFKFKGEYSALSHYKVKEANYSMNVFGFNTLLKMNTVNATFGMSKDKKLEKILEKKAPKDKVSPGNIEVEVRNGILNIK